jgi:hypothetical protein
MITSQNDKFNKRNTTRSTLIHLFKKNSLAFLTIFDFKRFFFVFSKLIFGTGRDGFSSLFWQGNNHDTKMFCKTEIIF